MDSPLGISWDALARKQALGPTHPGRLPFLDPICSDLRFFMGVAKKSGKFALALAMENPDGGTRGAKAQKVTPKRNLKRGKRDEVCNRNPIQDKPAW